MTTRVLILGAGFGGLELSTRLSDALGDEVAVTLIDQSDAFVFGYSKLDVMFGRQEPDAVRVPYRDIAKSGVEFRQEVVVAIDPTERRVETDRGSYDTDVLVVALGADLDVSATPGLAEGGCEIYSLEGAVRARDALASFESGAAVIAVCGPFFKCPPAPSEAALMLHDLLTKRGVRDAATISLVNPMGSPIPVSPETSSAVLAAFDERGIDFVPNASVTGLDPAAKALSLRDGTTIPYDLLLGVPVHRVPPVVEASGLTVDGWVPVDPATFATGFADVYAVGDVTSAPVPRAGVFAEGEAATVAHVLISRLRGGEPPHAYDGAGSCYIEFGDHKVARVDVDFLSGPAPTGRFNAPSRELAAEKQLFGSSRRGRWFG